MTMTTIDGARTAEVASLLPYPAYKPSGVDWLGDLPAHWGVSRLKQLCSRSALYGANVSASLYQESGIRFLRTTDITEDGKLRAGGVFLPEELVRDYTLSDGDILVSRSGTIGRSLLYSSELHGPCSYAGYLVRFVPNAQVLPEYVFLFTKTTAFAGFLEVMAISSTIANVSADKYANVHLPLPPPSEQRAIVRYLDHVDDRIRRYIAAREKLIALLEEERQAVIHRAVTRGLDPNVPLKPSGTDWLGDIPAHWGVRRLRSLASIGTGGQDTINRRDDGEYPFFVRSQTVERIDTWSFDGEAVLTAGDGVGVGKVFHYVKGKFDYHQRVYKFSDFVDVFGRFFFRYFMSTLRFEVYQGTAKSTVDSLRLPMLQNFLVALPPSDEQTAIVEYIDRATTDIDSATDRARRQIKLLQEYRTRLIADVVTGKLDVREAAALLPDDPGDSDPIDEGDPVECDVAGALTACDSLPSAGERTMESEVNV